MGPGLIVLAVVVTLVVAALMHHFSEIQVIRRTLRGKRPVPIAQAPEGRPVRLEGQVVDGETLSAPMSQRRCVYYVAIVEEYVSSKNSGRWRERVRESRGVPFAIDDGSGRAIVDVSGAKLDVALDHHTQSGTFDDATPVEQDFLERHGMKSQGWFFNKRLRYREGALEVGETVALAGHAVREPDPEGARGGGGAYRDAPATRLRLGGSSQRPILLSDSPSVRRG